MDSFNKLPRELRFQVLVSLDSPPQVVTAGHASRSLLQELRESKASIIRQYVLRDLDGDLDGDLLQDALAIIKFPRVDTSGGARQRVTAIHDHLCTWGAKELSDPFQSPTRDIDTMLGLQNLCRQMWRYIEDYLSKATSPFLPRAYRQLPPWSRIQLSSNPSAEMELAKDVRQFDLSSLGRRDRQRILRAFLRYELLCKIYGPVAGEPDAQGDLEHFHYIWGEGDPPDGYRFDENDPFRYWDWSILYRYEKREPEEAELHLLACVREYLLAMYGALIAHLVQAPLPGSGKSPEYENAPSSGMGGFPDYNPYNESEELYHLGGTGWSDTAVSLMATVGFDLLTTTLASGSNEFVKFLVDFNKEVLRSPPLVDATNVYLPISAPSRRRRIS